MVFMVEGSSESNCRFQRLIWAMGGTRWSSDIVEKLCTEILILPAESLILNSQMALVESAIDASVGGSCLVQSGGTLTR